jgi:hypothetical protein
MEDIESQRSIWLEVTNVRGVADRVEIQVKGDRAEREPVWWKVQSAAYAEFDDAAKAYRTLTEGLDKKRIVLAELGPQALKPANQGTRLECKSVRIQYAESNSR